MTPRLRIHMVGQRGVPATWGGVERHVEELGARLADRGHEVTVWSRAGYDDGRRRHRGMRVRRAPTVDDKHLEASVHAALATAAATAARPDIVHLHALGPGLFAPLPRLAGTRVVQTVHGFDHQRGKWGRVAGSVLRAGAWTSERSPHAVIGVSRQVADHYATHGRGLAVHVPNGVATPSTPDPSRLARFGIEPDGYVLWVGRLVPEKAPDLLVRAFARVPGDVRLVICGGSSHTDRYAAKVARLAAADPRIVLPGVVLGEDLSALYAHTAAFAIPSTLEGLPLTLLEAAAHAAPVVASDIAPHREVLVADGPGRRLVPAGDVRAVAAGLDRVLTSPTTERAGAEHLRREVLARYDWDAAADATEAVYLAVLGRGPVPPADLAVPPLAPPTVVDDDVVVPAPVAADRMRTGAPRDAVRSAASR